MRTIFLSATIMSSLLLTAIIAQPTSIAATPPAVEKTDEVACGWFPGRRFIRWRANVRQSRGVWFPGKRIRAARLGAC